MKNIVFFLTVVVFLSVSCTRYVPQPIVVPEPAPVVQQPIPATPAPAPKPTFVVDDNYILMSDVFKLNPGMTYSEVMKIIRISPYEVYSNVADNCIILKYLGKRTLRIHDEETGNVSPPLVFYPSSDTYKMTYSKPFQIHLILDGTDKKLRSYFTNTDTDFLIETNVMMKRAKLLCSTPSQIESKMMEWFPDKNKK